MKNPWKISIQMEGTSGHTDTGETFATLAQADRRADEMQDDADSRNWGVMRYLVLPNA